MSDPSEPVLIDPQDEPIIDTFDLVFLISAGLIAVLYLFRDTIFGAKKSPALPPPVPVSKPPLKKDKNFIKKMRNTDKNVVLFYGSQTGTAEDYASRLAKEGLQRFGLKTMTIDVEDCDMTLLDEFPEDCLAFFLMATYGEGEPTDDAIEFWELLNSDNPEFSQGISIEDKPLSSLRYVVFALGNKTYEHFNAVGRLVDAKLSEFGATRIGERGEGDDDGSLEEDFLGWKEDMWKAVCDTMNIDPNEAQNHGTRISAYKITELENYDNDSVFYGELSEHALNGGTRATYDAKNPFPSAITASRELFNSTERNCVHMELDITGSGLYYQSGDHVAVWPMNPEQDVYRLLKVLGLWEKKDTVVTIESTDPSASKKHPFPVPTTYATIFRNYLDINSPASRQFIATLANYAPTEEGKSRLTTLGQDKEAYRIEVAESHLTLGEVLELICSNGKPLDSIPLDLIIETLPRLQCRYYSISSTSKVTPTSIHITATVLRYQPQTAPKKTVYGLATNYIHQVHHKLNNIEHPDTSPYYLYSGPRDKYYDDTTNTIKFAIHVRNTNFKLPKNLKIPVVMVGPGTGVAPFRGFVIERAKYKSEGDVIGDTVLFFGCRKRDEDFLYAKEFDELFSALGETGNDAKNMARDVNNVLIQIAQTCGGMDENSAIAYVKDLRSRGRYQED
ncbi:11072_t:CDS:2, partial [Racocetra persica]